VRVKPSGPGSGLKSLFKPEYRTIDAVRGISLDVEEGEALAFLGPNGAGKSTTIKLLTGILYPSGGRIDVLGFDPQKDRKKLAFRIGSVFGQKSQLWYHLPARDSLLLLGAIYEIESAELKRRIGDLSERFSLGELMDIPVRKLSLGQRIRCELAASLLHKPRLLFLDEPTIGLDVAVKQEIRSLLGSWNKDQKVTLFLTSHDLGDVEKLCRRAVLIHHGALVLDESLKALKHKAAAKKIIGVRYTEPARPELPGLTAVKRTQDAAKFVIDTREHDLEEVMRSLMGQGSLADMTVEDEPLEDLIADLYRTKNEEEAHGLVGK
jgi:ABC-2 type transport system ATP-binding protein